MKKFVPVQGGGADGKHYTSNFIFIQQSMLPYLEFLIYYRPTLTLILVLSGYTWSIILMIGEVTQKLISLTLNTSLLYNTIIFLCLYLQRYGFAYTGIWF